MSISDQLTALSAQVAALSSSGTSGSNAPVLAAIAAVAAQIGGTPGTTPVSGSSALASLTFSPATLAGGASATGTVTLSAVQTTDAIVSLTSDNGAAVAPATVTVPAGSLSANFQVTTTSVPGNMTANLKASFMGANQSAALAITNG